MRDGLTATVSYTTADATWSQTFTARGLDDTKLAERLATVGLRLDRWLTEDGSWVAARPARGSDRT